MISTVGTSEPKPRPGYKAAGEGHCASAAGKELLCNLEAAQVIRRHNYQHFFLIMAGSDCFHVCRIEIC